MENWEMIGHQWAVEMMQQHIQSDQVRHAYLFSGPRGVGRRTLALRFAQALNCLQPPQPGIPCGTCRICRQTLEMQQADLHVIQAEIEGGVLKVEHIRDLQHQLSLAPYESNYRVALLLRFEEANASTQNALLKTLEEPNPRVVIVATVENEESLLPTIVSRCEVLRLRPLGIDELEKALLSRTTEEKTASLVAHVSGGKAGTALRMLEDGTLLERRRKHIDDLLSLNTSPLRERFDYADKVSKSRGRLREEVKQDLRPLLEDWLSFWRDVLLVSTGAAVPINNLDYQNEIKSAAERFGIQGAKSKVNKHQQALRRMYFANLRLLMEIVLL